MNQAIQPEMHPDAETLTAFGEQLLSAPERDEIIMHLAECARCREVVFLARSAEMADEPVSVAVATRKRDERWWFGSWRWAWIPAAAMAGVIGVAVLAHYRHAESPAQMAGNVAQTDALRQSIGRATAATMRESDEEGAAQQKQTKEKSATEPARTIIARGEKKKESTALDDKDVSRRDKGIVTANAGSPAASEASDEVAARSEVIGGVSGQSIHGAATRSNGQSLGGPMAANQYQQQNAPTQNAVQFAKELQSFDARKPEAKSTPTAANETVEVQTAPQIAAAQPAAPKSMPVAPTTPRSLDSSKLSLGLKKTSNVVLPSGLGVLSSASLEGRRIALDTSGALFVNEGGEENWQPVKSQWAGRAVLVRALRFPASTSTVLATVQTPRFELVTDKLQTWVSADGKTWTASPIK